MSESNVIDLSGRVTSADPLTEMLRTGAQQLIQEAVELEVQALLAQYSEVPYCQVKKHRPRSKQGDAYFASIRRR